jgi:hypothetical protein
MAASTCIRDVQPMKKAWADAVLAIDEVFDPVVHCAEHLAQRYSIELL